MKDVILNLEEDFANNEYFGTNVWTEEKYRVLSGNFPVLLSAPHSVNQIRGDDVRDAEKYTGAIVRYLSRATNSYGIFELFTHADPNYDTNHDYKNAIINLIETYNITNNRESLCGNYELIDKFKTLAIKHGIKVDENNIPNKDAENEIIAVSALICGIPSIRLVINNSKLDLESGNDKIESICKTIEEFILQID